MGGRSPNLVTAPHTRVGAAVYYTEKPYKWDDEHHNWVRLGRPKPPEPGVKSDTTAWDAFVALIDV